MDIEELNALLKSIWQKPLRTASLIGILVALTTIGFWVNGYLSEKGKLAASPDAPGSDAGADAGQRDSVTATMPARILDTAVPKPPPPPVGAEPPDGQAPPTVQVGAKSVLAKLETEPQDSVPFFVDPKTAVLFRTQDVDLRAYELRDGTREEVFGSNWTSMKPSVVSVSEDGIVTAVKRGDGRIRVSRGGANAMVCIDVQPVAFHTVVDSIIVTEDGPGDENEWRFSVWVVEADSQLTLPIQGRRYSNSDDPASMDSTFLFPQDSLRSLAAATVETLEFEVHVHGEIPKETVRIAGAASFRVETLLEDTISRPIEGRGPGSLFTFHTRLVLTATKELVCGSAVNDRGHG